MICTDFRNIKTMVKRVLETELKNALQQHGGSYEWDDEQDPPIVAATIYDNVEDVRIRKAWIYGATSEVKLNVESVLETRFDIAEAWLDEIEEFDIQYIIEYMKNPQSIREDIRTGLQQDLNDFCIQIEKEL